MTKHLSEPPTRPSSLGIEVPASVENALMRSLAKKADDRFANAREMRKILEHALREADPGLVDTQRVSGEALSDLRAAHKKARDQVVTNPDPATPTSRRVATANDLADQLEGSTGALRRKPRSVVPWLALGGVLLAGVGVATVLLLRGNHKPTSNLDPFVDLSLAAGVTFDNVMVVTDGTVTAKAVADAYRTEIGRVQRRIDEGLAKRKLEAYPIPAKVSELYAVPQPALCIKKAYVSDEFVPKDCATDAFAFTTGWRNGELQPRLLLVSSKIQEAVVQGVGYVVCAYLPDETARSKLICDLARGVDPID